MLKLFLVSGFLMPFYSKCQTCIIAKKTVDKIYFGADSRERYALTINNITTSKYLSVCKIHSEGTFYFASAGVGFNTLGRIIRNACRKSKTIEGVIAQLRSNIINVFRDTLDLIRRIDPSAYTKMINGWAYSIIFAHFEKGVPIIKLVALKPITQVTENVIVQMDTLSNNFIPEGIFEEIINDMNIEATWKNPVEAIKKLIRIEIKAYPDEVAEPIDIIEINSTGFKWIDNKKSCTIH